MTDAPPEVTAASVATTTLPATPKPAPAPPSPWRPHPTFTNVVADVPPIGPVNLQLSFESVGPAAAAHAQRGEQRFYAFETSIRALAEKSDEFIAWRSASCRAAELLTRRKKLKAAVARHQDAADESLADAEKPLDDSLLAESLKEVTAIKAQLEQLESALPGVKSLEAERASALHQRIQAITASELLIAQTEIASNERAAFSRLIADGAALNAFVEARVAAAWLSYSMSRQSAETLTKALIGRIPDFVSANQPEPPQPQTVDLHCDPPVRLAGPIALKVR